MLKTRFSAEKQPAHKPKNLETQAIHGRSHHMAKVALDGTINIQATKEIDRTNAAQLSPAAIAPVVCPGFAQLCEIGPIDFLRSLYVDSTIQGDFGHVVRSSMGCLGSEICWVMCLNLHIPDNAEKHCFEHF